MKFSKGRKKTGGRSKGTPNKFNETIQAVATRIGVNPFEVLCMFAANDWKGLGYENEVYHKETASGEVKLGYVITPDLRVQAAKEATKYLYPQKKAVEHTGEIDLGLIEDARVIKAMSDEELKKLIEEH